MVGKKRFSFEIVEHNRSSKIIASLLGNRLSMFPPSSSLAVQLARPLAPVLSIQVKFEDIESIAQHGREVTFTMKAPVLCYAKPAGEERRAQLSVTADVTGGAKSLHFKTAAPRHESDEMQQKGKFPPVPFALARQLAMESCDGLRSLFQGVARPARPIATPQKKRPNPEAAATVTKRLKKEAKGGAKASADAVASVDPDAAKVSLNTFVQQLADAVDADWHDSYEETSEMLQDWLQDCGERSQSVLKVGIRTGAEFGCCHEVLKHIADTWANIKAIPFRGTPDDDLAAGEGFTLVENGEEEDEEENDCDGSVCVHSSENLLKLVWPPLLARAAADELVPEDALMRMIKDSHDNGVKEPHLPSKAEGKLSLPTSVLKELAKGRRRLATLMDKPWQALPTTTKQHRMRRCIDRRFDGSDTDF